MPQKQKIASRTTRRRSQSPKAIAGALAHQATTLKTPDFDGFLDDTLGLDSLERRLGYPPLGAIVKEQNALVASYPGDTLQLTRYFDRCDERKRIAQRAAYLLGVAVGVRMERRTRNVVDLARLR